MAKNQIAAILNQYNVAELGKLFPIELHDYNPSWPNFYSLEKEAIIKEFLEGEIIMISHIGSTAIPGIKAKPTIDILLEISQNTIIETLHHKLLGLNYTLIHRPENPPPHMMLVKGYSTRGFEGQAFHIHVRYEGGWDEKIFCKHLQLNHQIAKEYEKLKVLLAKKHHNNREAYTNGKTDFIKAVMRQIKILPGKAI